MKKILIIATLLAISNSSKAQCPAGQVQVTIDITTDAYGYEGYWELLPSGNACGVGTIASGGNSAQVGCNGGGAPYTATSGNGYGNNTTITAGPYCLTTGNSYSIKYIDDYGDGGFHFTVKIAGFPIYQFTGSAAVQTFNFTASPPPSFDLGVTKIQMPLYGQPGNKNIKGAIFNYGSTTITSFELNYKINNGPIFSQTISGLNIPGYTSYNFSHPTLWNALNNGTDTIDVWATNLNGNNLDTNTANDHKTFVYVVGPATPNIIDNYFQANYNFTTIANSSDGILQPRDLDFHPILSRNELWVVLKSTEAIGGKTAKISNAGASNQSVLVQQDGNAWHFMSLPTGIAFSDNGNFATSPGVLDANHGSGHFTGPTLWNSDPTIYAQPSGGNGSHIDMLHECPYAMGIAWEKDNVFWVVDTYYGDLMRNDFGEPHEPGGSDHSDGRIREYNDFIPTRINLEIPCHVVLDENKKWLYIVDGGNNKIRRMDITTGSQTGTFTPYGEPLAESSIYTGTTWSDYITSGTIQPSGIDVIGNRLLVSDYSSGDIIIYDCSGATGVELGRIKTNTPGVQGIKIGPDGKIWYVNYLTNEVKRVDYTPWSASVTNLSETINSVYPNPSNGLFNILLNQELSSNATIGVYDIVGNQIKSIPIQKGKRLQIDLSGFASGTYFLNINSENKRSTQKLILIK